MLSDFICKTGRLTGLLLIEREVSADVEIRGKEELAVIGLISVKCERSILAKAKRSSLGRAMKQCLLAMMGVWLCYGAEAIANARIRWHIFSGCGFCGYGVREK